MRGQSAKRRMTDGQDGTSCDADLMREMSSRCSKRDSIDVNVAVGSEPSRQQSRLYRSFCHQSTHGQACKRVAFLRPRTTCTGVPSDLQYAIVRVGGPGNEE